MVALQRQLHGAAAPPDPKGRPPFKQKQSKVEKIVRRKRQKKIQVESNVPKTKKKAPKKQASDKITKNNQFAPEDSTNYIAIQKDNVTKNCVNKMSLEMSKEHLSTEQPFHSV
ncbi:hypothetical protein TorRG33x02_184710 [Trema orientale]|uniref:Uncharacterized protein n=1 Tax=Trema orientale TaxID=63057 RepID=A0A2P5EJM3_TREOI|nr:hypothetical protein TorRG33x02_184710 [Trema orientale]